MWMGSSPQRKKLLGKGWGIGVSNLEIWGVGSWVASTMKGLVGKDVGLEPHLKCYLASLPVLNSSYFSLHRWVDYNHRFLLYSLVAFLVFIKQVNKQARTCFSLMFVSSAPSYSWHSELSLKWISKNVTSIQVESIFLVYICELPSMNCLLYVG